MSPFLIALQERPILQECSSRRNVFTVRRILQCKDMGVKVFFLLSTSAGNKYLLVIKKFCVFEVFCGGACNVQVFVVGNIPELGEWDDGAALPLTSSVGDDFLWQCMTTVRRENFPIHYKYILKNRFGEVVSETGADRELKCDSARKPAAMVITSDGSFQVRFFFVCFFLLLCKTSEREPCSSKFIHVDLRMMTYY